MAETKDVRTVVGAYFAAVDANDFDALLELFDDDIVYERPGYEPMRGKDRLRQFFTTERVIASGKHQIEDILAVGDKATAWGSFQGTSHDGNTLSEKFCDVYEFRNQRIYRRSTYFFRAAV